MTSPTKIIPFTGKCSGCGNPEGYWNGKEYQCARCTRKLAVYEIARGQFGNLVEFSLEQALQAWKTTWASDYFVKEAEELMRQALESQLEFYTPESAFSHVTPEEDGDEGGEE